MLILQLGLLGLNPGRSDWSGCGSPWHRPLGSPETRAPNMLAILSSPGHPLHLLGLLMRSDKTIDSQRQMETHPKVLFTTRAEDGPSVTHTSRTRQPPYLTMGSLVRGTGGRLRPSGRVMSSIVPGHLDV